MSRLAILAPFLLLSGIVVAKVDVPTVDCGPTLSWTSNSIGQNPCVVAAHLMATCSGGSFSMPPLQQNNSYYGPARDDDSDAKDLCKCNTVVYSLLSACDACQQQEWIAWSRYSSNCTTIAPVSSFPYRIPSGTYVPYWALFDVTLEDNWNTTTSFAIGDFPELTPGMLSSNASSTSPTPTPTHTIPSPTRTHSSSSNAGAIAGGVVGGVAAIAVAGLAIFFWLRRKRPRAP